MSTTQSNDNTDNSDVCGIVARMIQSNYMSYANTTSALIDGYERQISELRYVLGTIRLNIIDMCYGPSVPATWRIINALYPEIPTDLHESDSE
jgi:hypothetical protein